MFSNYHALHLLNAMQTSCTAPSTCLEQLINEPISPSWRPDAQRPEGRRTVGCNICHTVSVNGGRVNACPQRAAAHGGHWFLFNSTHYHLNCTYRGSVQSNSFPDTATLSPRAPVISAQDDVRQAIRHRCVSHELSHHMVEAKLNVHRRQSTNVPKI